MAAASITDETSASAREQPSHHSFANEALLTRIEDEFPEAPSAVPPAAAASPVANGTARTSSTAARESAVARKSSARTNNAVGVQPKRSVHAVASQHTEWVPAAPIGAKGRAQLAFEAIGQGSRRLLRGIGNDKAGRDGMIHPESQFRLFWDATCVVMVLYSLVLVPVTVCFYFNGAPTGLFVFNALVDFFFIADIAVVMLTGVYDPAHRAILWDRGLIARRYLRGLLVIDVIAALPLDIFIDPLGTGDRSTPISDVSDAYKVLRVFYLLKGLRVFRLLRPAPLLLRLFHFSSNVMRVAKFSFALFIFLHWEACIWCLIAYMSGYRSLSWVTLVGLTDGSPFELYTWALLYVVSIISTSGYARYTPKRLEEVWVTTTFMFVGNIWHVVVVGFLVSFVLRFDAPTRLFEERVRELDQYMIDNRCHADFRRKVLDYYAHKYHSRKMYNDHTIFSDLSDNLRKEIALQNCAKLVVSVPFLCFGDLNFVSAVVSRMRPCVFMPGELVIEEGAVGKEMYFIEKGIVEVFKTITVGSTATDNDIGGATEEIVTATLCDGAFFGEIALLSTRIRRAASVRAIIPCNCYCLTHNDLTAILVNYPDMRRYLHEVSVRRLQDISKVNMSAVEASVARDEEGPRLSPTLE